MEKDIADVSIVVANYNNGKYISRLITSVINSTILPKQLIIVDDGSVDDSIVRCEHFLQDYKFIELIKFPANRGFANALNEGLSQAKGKYVMRVDSDDYIDSLRIERQFDYLQANGHVDVVGSNISYFDSDSGAHIFNSNVPLVHADIKTEFEKGNCGIIHGSMMCKKVVITSIGYKQSSVPAEDYELFSTMIKGGSKVINLPDALTFVRVHANSVSNNLPFETIAKTFRIRSRIWGTKSSNLEIKVTHLYLLNYRRFLFSKGIQRYIYLFLAVLFNPRKLVARIFNYK